jgi:hypothetical protein
VTTDATRAHIDAETMAAWAERALSADASAAVELHLSNCDRCQEVLAAFIRSAPATGAVVIPFWARRPVQWSAAGLAAAAALVAMVWIGRPPAAPAPESTVASKAVAPETSARAIDQLQTTPAAANPVPAESRQERARAAQDKPASATEPRPDRPSLRQQDRSAAEQASNKKQVAGQGATLGVGAAAVAALPSPLAAPPPPPPSALAQIALGPPPVAVTGAAPVVTPVVTPAGTLLGAAKPPAMAESVSDAFSAVLPVVEIIAPNLRREALMARDAGRGGAAARALSENVTPTRWRIVAGTVVQQSLDAGATWNVLPIEPALKTPLLAGSATSPTNCWLVGRDGVVLVTYGGRTFRRVSVPEVVHLTGVTAVDGMRATVTAIDGRKFTTTDGGLTWK